MSARRKELGTDWLFSNRRHTIAIILSVATITSHNQRSADPRIQVHYLLQRREAFVIAVAGVPGSRSRRGPGQSYSDASLPEARDGRLIFVKMVA
jgi:hypothetical protein